MLEKQYPKEEAESSLRKPVAFEREIVTLNIPKSGIELPSGWSIVPMAHPASVSLSSVLSFIFYISLTFFCLFVCLF